MPTAVSRASKGDNPGELAEQSSLSSAEALTATPIVGSAATMGVKLSVERTCVRALTYKLAHTTFLKNFSPFLTE
jgi:hypothetical protein